MTNLTPTTTARGFDHMEPIPSEYGGNVSVSESSNAEYAGIWLRAEDVMPGRTSVTAAINLTAENAWLLGRQLLWLVVNHYHGDSRPDGYAEEAHAALDVALTATEREQGDPPTNADELLELLTKAGFALVRVSEADTR